MATYNPIQTVTVVPSGAISPYRFVSYAGAQAGAGVAARGVTHDGAEATDKSCAVIALGTGIVEAGGAFSPGDKLAADANGKAVVATIGKHINAIAVDAATADGDLAEVEIVKPAVVAP